MGSELELKAVVADPTATREALRAAGAQRTFEGMLRDRRLDREANLSAGDRVLRLREWAPSSGAAQTVIGWKGPTRVARFEWYPRLHVLVEIEGPPEGIERVIAAAGLARRACLPDPLATFAACYEARTGRPAVLSEAALDGDCPAWNAR